METVKELTSGVIREIKGDNTCQVVSAWHRETIQSVYYPYAKMALYLTNVYSPNEWQSLPKVIQQARDERPAKSREVVLSSGYFEVIAHGFEIPAQPGPIT